MIDENLRRALAEHYEAESLSPETLERLLDQAAAPVPARRTWRWAWAAAAALLLGVAVRWAVPRAVDRDTALVTRAVAAEILSHERAGMPVAFRGSSADAVQREMPRLDFRLAEPRRLAGESLALVGARYCTIRGGLAAQIRLRDASGRFRNVYLCPLRPRLARVREGEVEIDGVPVVIWREGELLFGMVRSA